MAIKVTGNIIVSDTQTLSNVTVSGLKTAINVSEGGTGVSTITGIIKGSGTSAFSAAVAGTDYVSPTGTENVNNKTLNVVTLNTASILGTTTGSDGLLTRVMLQDTGWDYYDSSTTSALDYINGSVQRWAPTGGSSVTLSIANWPPSGALGELLIEGINLGNTTITWPTVKWIKNDGTGNTDTTFANAGYTLQSSGTDWVFLWTRDAGSNAYGKIIR